MCNYQVSDPILDSGAMAINKTGKPHALFAFMFALVGETQEMGRMRKMLPECDQATKTLINRHSGEMEEQEGKTPGR